MVYAFGIISIANASTEEGELSAPRSKISRPTLLTPIEIADFFVVIDNKQFNGDPRRKEIDPLKLQKLLYYAFAYNMLVTGEHLWDIDRYPIIANFHGPFVQDVHNEYKGSTIESFKIEKAQKRLKNSDLEDILYSTYLTYIDKTGKDLEDKSHKELPYENASRSGVRSLISVLDIATEFESPHQKIGFMKGLCELASQKMDHAIEKIIERVFISLVPREIAAILDKFPIPTALQLRIADKIYPQELLSNVDAKDSLFGRPRVIEKVAISARLGNLTAKINLAEIFEFFSCESTDLYGKTSALIMSELPTSSDVVGLSARGSDSLTFPDYHSSVAGYVEYEMAQQKTTRQESMSLYQTSLEAGYARSGFEIAKNFIEQENFVGAKEYLNKAFEKGMLTATDLMIELPDDILNDAQKLSYLKNRGDRGDPMGYYQLAKKFHQRGNVPVAVDYYKKALPFLGITELRKLLKKNPSLAIVDSSLSKKGFFEDIIELYHNETLLQLWFRDTE